MPIRINLLAEQQYQEELRWKDPLKRAIFGCVLAILMVLSWYGWLMMRHGFANSEIARQEGELKAMADNVGSASGNKDAILKIERNINDLNRMATNRVLWASFMNVLQKNALTKVPINSVQVSQTYEYTAAVMENKRIKSLSSATEHIRVTIAARDYGRREDALYSKFVDQLKEDPWMKKHLAEQGGITLGGFSAPTPDKDKPGEAFQSFTMFCNFKRHVRN